MWNDVAGLTLKDVFMDSFDGDWCGSDGILMEKAGWKFAMLNWEHNRDQLQIMRSAFIFILSLDI